MVKESKIFRIYSVLKDAYGPQGWWPVSVTGDLTKDGINSGGYHPGSYEVPRNDEQRFEIAIGAVLTQNTNWNNAAAALTSLHNARLFSIGSIQNASIDQIALVIKSAGYYNQKARYLKNLADYFSMFPFKTLIHQPLDGVRRDILTVKGIGPETADCILLYALGIPTFVIDAYTTRIVTRLGLVPSGAKYHSIKALFEQDLKKDLSLFQEFHALFVEHGKRYYQKKPYGDSDWLMKEI